MKNPRLKILNDIPGHLRYAISEHSSIALLGGIPETRAIYYANPAACKLFGYTLEEFLSKTRDDIFEASEEFTKAFPKRSETGSTFAELNCIHKNGKKFLCETSSVLFTDEDGIVKSSNTIIDITEKKKIEEELRKSNERYQLATRASFDAIWDSDLIKQTINWGEGFETLFGYKVGIQPVRISTWEDNIHPDDREKVLSRLHKILQENSGQDLWSDQYRFLKADGTIAYVIDRGLIIRDENKKALRIVGAMQDITELKMKEQELTDSNNRFDLASRATSDIIWDWDLETNNVIWSDNLTRIMGHKLPADSKLPVDSCLQKFHPEDRERVYESLTRAINDASRNNWEQEFRYRKDDGSYAQVHDRGYILRDDRGKAKRIIGAMHDISKTKYHENLMALELLVYEGSSTPDVSFEKIVNILLQGLEAIHPEMYSSVLLLNENNTVRHLSSPRLPREYTQLIDGLSIGPYAGSCGTSMFRKEPVIVSDISIDPLWKNYMRAAELFGLKACWSLPIILSNGKVLGSFAIYYHYPKEPTKIEWNTVTKMRNLLAILWENYLAVKEINSTNERYNIVLEATHDMVWDWNLETGEIYRDQRGLKKVYGMDDNQAVKYFDKLLEYVHPEDRQKVESTIEKILSATDRDTFDLEYRIRTPEGTYFNVYDRGIKMVNAEGKPYRMIGAAQNITERRLLEQELLEQEIQKQKIISQTIINTQEQERASIGKELHDNVNQVLTTTKLYLDLLAADPDKQREFIKKSSDNILYVINEIRKLTSSLMEPSLGDLGLMDSITNLIETVDLTQKFNVALDHDPEIEQLLNDNQKLTIYRIIQEAMNNIVKHAEAKSVLIQLNKYADKMQLIIKDDGIGFDHSKNKKGIGLKNIQNRVYLFNGTLDIHTTTGNGCELRIAIPLLKERS